MYEQFYGLRERPFSLSPDPQFMLMTAHHGMALAMLEYGLFNQAMITVLTGEVGSGKTTVVRYLLNRMGRDTTVGLVNCTPDRSASVLQWIAVSLDLPTVSGDSATLYRALTDFVVREYAAGRRVLLIIDEAQNLSPARLEELRVLTNLNTDRHMVLYLMLVGQPELRRRIHERGGEAFAQRIGVAFHVGALDEAETGEYLAHRLLVAGRSAPLFSAEAVSVLHRHAAGIPRRINQLAASALLEAFSRDAAEVGVEAVEAAAADLAAYLGAPGGPG
jgi:general secretion pathway protein A